MLAVIGYYQSSHHIIGVQVSEILQLVRKIGVVPLHYIHFTICDRI